MEITSPNSSFSLLSKNYYNDTSCDIFNLKTVDQCWMYIIWVALELFGITVGFPVHTMVLCVLKQINERDSSSFYIYNMTVMDLLYCFSMSADVINYYFLHNDIINRFFRFTSTFNIVGSPLFLCALCVERYLAVVWAFSYARFRRLRYKVGSCAIIWLIVTICGTTNVINNHIFLYEDSIYIYFLIGAFTVMIFCSLSILKVLRKSVPGGNKIHPIKEKASRTVFIILIFMIVMYFPSVAILPFQRYYPSYLYEYYLVPGCISVSTASSSIHALLYLYILDKLPLGGKLWKMRCCWRET